MDLLWKKESNSEDALLVDIFKDVANQSPIDFKLASKINSCSGEFKSSPKSDVLSAEYREQGNKKIEEQNWTEAMHFYNKSLCFAAINSENVSLAFVQRSACFFRLGMYENCLIDIDLAIKANYQLGLMDKLKQQQDFCMESMKNKENTAKSNLKAHEKFPAMSNALAIDQLTGYDRGIVAKRNIDVGEIILTEETFISYDQFDEPKNCSSCSKNVANFIPCNKCSDAMFCSEACMNEKNFHKMCCDFDLERICEAKAAVELVLIGLNVFSNEIEWMEFVESAINDKTKRPPNSLVDMKSKYLALLQLNIFASPKRWKKFIGEAFVAYTTLMLLDSVQKKCDTKKKKRFLMHLTLHSYSVFRGNAYDLDLYITKSYFNHSCVPNVFFLYVGNITVGIALRPINKGEQLFVTYSGDASGDLTECQEYFLNGFGFECKCEKCKPMQRILASKCLKSDSDYQLTAAEIRKQKGLNIYGESTPSLRKNCRNLLQKYGRMHWCRHLGLISHGYIKLTEKETMELSL